MKYFATFGSDHLKGFELPVGPLGIMLVSKPDQSEWAFREMVFDEIGQFCTTYSIDEADKMSKDYGMIKMTIDELKEYRA